MAEGPMTDFISDKDFIPDSTPAGKASPPGDGFIPDSAFVSDEDKYGDTLGQIKSFGLGAGRSASFGLSDEFLVQTGAMKPEDIKAYRETNPYSSIAGEVGGVLGAVLAPEVGILGALSAPVRGVAALGKSAGALVPGAASTVGKILSQTGAIGLGSAVEGAAYGLGQSVSEHALGDPDLNAEKVLANVGTSALIGGALGSMFGAAKGVVQTKFPKFLSEVDKAAIDSGDWKSMANASDLSESQKQGFIAGLTKKKVNASEIEKAAKEIDAPILPSMISDNGLVQKGQSALLDGPPSLPAIKAQQIAAQGLEKAELATQQALGSADDITKANLGDTLKGIVSESVESQSKPITALYDELKTRYQSIPTSDKSLKQIAANMRKIEDVPLSPQARAIAESAADRLETVKTIDDVKRLRSIINQELGLSSTPIQKRVTAIIGDKLADLEESSIVRFAQKEMKTSVAKDKIMQLLDQREAVNAQYSVFKDKIQRLGEVMGRKRVHGAQDFLDFLDDMTPEKIADKLSSKNNSEFLNWFSKELPQGMQSIAQYQKGVIRDVALKDGKLNIKRVISEFDKMPKEYRSKIFSPEEIKKIEAIKTYIEAFPKNYNPSNTANMSAFRGFFEHPVGSVVANVRDYGIQGFLDAATGSGDKTKAFVDGLSTLEKQAIKTTKAISSGANAIFSESSGTPAPVKGYLAVSSSTRRDDHDKMNPQLSELTNDPQKLIDKIHENTEALSLIAPKTSQAAQGTMTRATQFLQQKLPGINVPQKPLSPKYKPSDAELAKWYKYFSAVDKPTDVLKSVASGNLVPETMEALSFVYPKLLQEMRTSVTDKMVDSIAKKKVIPYRTKLSLSLFLGQDLVNSLDPTSMLANQNMMATATQGKNMQSQQMGKVTQGGLSKLDSADDFLTPMQKSNQRKDS